MNGLTSPNALSICYCTVSNGFVIKKNVGVLFSFIGHIVYGLNWSLEDANLTEVGIGLEFF
jgi:hypothetical protein